MVERIILRKQRNLEELVLDMVSTPNYVLESVDWGVIKGTHHTYKYVNQVGESITNTSLGMREIIIKGWIVAEGENKMSSLKMKLNSFINPQETFDLLYNNYVISFKPDESVKYSADSKENNDAFCKFQINGTASNPLFSDNYETRSAFVSTTPSFYFPLIISQNSPEKGVVFGKRSPSLIVSLTNKGSVPVGMKIVFKANGSVTNPSLLNIGTQERFKIDKHLVVDEEIEINTNIGSKSVRGKIGNENFSNYFMYKTIDSSWLQLDVGNNSFRYEADEGVDNLDVFVYFYNQYLEVQECN